MSSLSCDTSSVQISASTTIWCFLLHHDSHVFIVPEEEFKDIFILKEDQRESRSIKSMTFVATPNPKYVFHSHSGGLDTYLQGCWLNHIRSWVHDGNWEKTPILIVGSYPFQFKSTHLDNDESDFS